jgi:hypothetical protein
MWPGQRRSSGLRLVGVVGWALVAAVAASAQVQYRDRNGQTWSAPNQIDRQRREDNQARHDANSVSNNDNLTQELAAYWRQERAWEEGQRRMHEENNRRNEEIKREWARQAKEADQRARAAREAEKEKYLAEQRWIVAGILQEAKAAPGVLANSKWSRSLVAGLGEGLITGSFHGLSLAALNINYSAQDRYQTALKLFREADCFPGRKENRNFGAGAHDYDFINRAGFAMLGSGTDARAWALNWKQQISESDDGVEILVALGCSLAMTKSDWDQERRELATLLLADAMGRVNPARTDDGAAFGCILVAAAQRTPALRRVPALHEKIIPVVRDSIWAQGFASWPWPEKDHIPLVVKPARDVYWNLAAMLVLSSEPRLPMRWFANLRHHRRVSHLAPVTPEEKAMVQGALKGWLARSSYSPAMRETIQADCDLACEASEVALAGSTAWDAALRIGGGVLYTQEELAAVRAVLRSPTFLGQPGVRWYFATAPFKSRPEANWPMDGVVYTFLGEACAEGPDHSTRVLTALRWMTENNDAVSFREMPRAKWETLVKLGEGFCAAGDPQWTESSVGARLAWLRSERLDDEAGARKWLAAPGRQPRDGDTPEKWREWATLAGLPGIRIAAQRHPEYFTEPALLRRALADLAGNGRRALSPAERLTAKALLAHAGELTDRETVLAVAKVRGFGLGDWAKLGAWLDVPARRPKGPDDPLYPLFVDALMERDQVEGYLSEEVFQASELGHDLQQFERWLKAVLTAKGEQRSKLIDDHFPGVIDGPDAARPYPDLRMLGYDIGRGGWASRALLLLSSAEFDPTQALITGFAIIDGDDGKPVKIGGYDVEPWLSAVAKLPRAVKPEALLAELSDTLKTLRAEMGKLDVSAPAQPETKPRELTEEEEGLLREKEFREMIEDRRTRFVGVGCQDALARLASRWSPVRAPAQAALLALGDHLFLDDEGKTKVSMPGLAARIKWEQAKMGGLDNAAAWAAVRTTLREEDVRTLAKLAEAKGSFVLESDFNFDREVKAAAAVMAR